jgi:Leucine-rich repeat (LRR) protein
MAQFVADHCHKHAHIPHQVVANTLPDYKSLPHASSCSAELVGDIIARRPQASAPHPSQRASLFWTLMHRAQLKTLSLANNEISVIENVQQLTTLEKLNISRNRLSSLEGLAALRSLLEVDVSFNSLQSVEAQQLPPRLQVLNVGSNCIQQLHGVASLAHASHLTALRIAGAAPSPSHRTSSFIAPRVIFHIADR